MDDMQEYEDDLKPSRETVRFQVDGEVELEGELYRPTFGENEQGKYFAVAIFHPHPKLGGCFNNALVIELAKELVSVGGLVLCVNTRGVGNSTGSSSWKGDAEVADVKASVKYLHTRDDVRAVYLVGYSFGTAIVASAASELKPHLRGFALISPPWGFFGSKLLGHHYKKLAATDGIPKLVVAGTMDTLANRSTLQKGFRSLPEPKQDELVTAASHFWLGMESKGAQPVAKFFQTLEYRPELQRA